MPVEMGIRIQTVVKFYYLRQLAELAKKTAQTLRETILAAQKQVFTPSFQQGRLIVSNSGSGQSGSFQMADDKNTWTQPNIAGLLEEFIQQLDYTVAQGTPDAADADLINALVSQMMTDITEGNSPQIGIREQMGDFSGLNFPANSTR